jgi:hypothetical protein
MKSGWGLRYDPSPSSVKARTDVQPWRPSGNLAGHILHNVEIVDPFKDYRSDYSLSDWDGYGAHAIELDTIDAARSLYRFLSNQLRVVSPPHIAPGPDGTIGFEWRFQVGDYIKLFVEVLPRYRLQWYAVRRSDNHFEEQPPVQLERGKETLQAFFKRLIREG